MIQATTRIQQVWGEGKDPESLRGFQGMPMLVYEPLFEQQGFRTFFSRTKTKYDELVNIKKQPCTGMHLTLGPLIT